MTQPIQGISRRQLIRYSFAGSALIIAAPLTGCNRPQDGAVDQAVDLIENDVAPFIVIRSDNKVVISFPNPEMGQGVDTSLPMLVAEELEVDFSKVETVQLPLSIVKGDDGNMRWQYVPQGSGGSNSISGHWEALRRAGAFGRELLKSAAAQKWSVPVTELTAQEGFILHQNSDQRISYADLAELAGQMPAPEDEAELKSASEFKLIGRAQKMKNARAIVTGQPLYGIDTEIPDMKYAVMARCPYFDGTARTVDERAARAVPGVIDVVKIDRPEPGSPYTVQAEGYAVVADNFWAAKRGRDALEIDWDEGEYAAESSANFRAHCAELLAGQGQIVRDDGDFDAGFEQADSTFEQTYWLPYISHAPLEPQNCVADVRPDGIDIYAPTQMPSSASRLLGNILERDRTEINIVPTRLGGGFGRRLTNDYVAEAALISKAAGAPIKLIWTREDDMRHDFYRPAGMHQLKAGFDADGNLVAWTHRLASASKYYRRPNMPDENLWQSELYPDDFPAYLTENYRLEYFPAVSGAPRGSWRAPAHTANAFVVQSFLNEIAEARGENPLALRLRLLGTPRELTYGGHGGPTFNPGRLAGVLRLAAEKGNFGADMPKGQGRGISAHFTFGGYVAQIVDVEVSDDGALKVLKVVGAVDIGTVVNPNGVAAQMEGGINDGLSTALRLAIDIWGGRVTTGNFDSYPLMKIADAPPVIETHIVESDLPPMGMGEMSLPPLAPALTHAIYQACGKQITELPIADQLRA